MTRLSLGTSWESSFHGGPVCLISLMRVWTSKSKAETMQLLGTSCRIVVQRALSVVVPGLTFAADPAATSELRVVAEAARYEPEGIDEDSAGGVTDQESPTGSQGGSAQAGVACLLTSPPCRFPCSRSMTGSQPRSLGDGLELFTLRAPARCTGCGERDPGSHEHPHRGAVRPPRPHLVLPTEDHRRRSDSDRSAVRLVGRVRSSVSTTRISRAIGSSTAMRTTTPSVMAAASIGGAAATRAKIGLHHLRP